MANSLVRILVLQSCPRQRADFVRWKFCSDIIDRSATGSNALMKAVVEGSEPVVDVSNVYCRACILRYWTIHNGPVDRMVDRGLSLLEDL